MIVLDASILVELLTAGPLAEKIRSALSDAEPPYLAPYLVDLEIVSALRNLTLGHRLPAARFRLMAEMLNRIPIERYPHDVLIPRIWDLRDNFTAYDAAYISLAEMTGSTLFTCDEKLRRGHRARVVCFRQQQ